MYVICSLQQRTDHFTCSPGDCWRTNRVKQAGCALIIVLTTCVGETRALSPSENRWSDEQRPAHLPDRHRGPSTARLTARWRVTWVLKQTHWCCCCCSAAQSCPTRCKPVDCSTPSFPVLHYLPEFAQTCPLIR